MVKIYSCNVSYYEVSVAILLLHSSGHIAVLFCPCTHTEWLTAWRPVVLVQYYLVFIV
jgi:hypothetical protein